MGMSLHQHDLWHSFDTDYAALCQAIPGHSLELAWARTAASRHLLESAQQHGTSHISWLHG